MVSRYAKARFRGGMRILLRAHGPTVFTGGRPPSARYPSGLLFARALGLTRSYATLKTGATRFFFHIAVKTGLYGSWLVAKLVLVVFVPAKANVLLLSEI